MTGVILPTVLLTAVAALAAALLTSSWPRSGPLAGDEQQASGAATMPTAVAFGIYPGQQQRGVVPDDHPRRGRGQDDRGDGIPGERRGESARVLVSADAGASWHLAPVDAPAGVTATLGHPAMLLAGGPGG